MDSRGAVIMPPTMGAAMRCITSEPVPVPHMMGTGQDHRCPWTHNRSVS